MQVNNSSVHDGNLFPADEMLLFFEQVHILAAFMMCVKQNPSTTAWILVVHTHIIMSIHYCHMCDVGLHKAEGHVWEFCSACTGG